MVVKGEMNHAAMKLHFVTDSCIPKPEESCFTENHSMRVASGNLQFLDS